MRNFAVQHSPGFRTEKVHFFILLKCFLYLSIYGSAALFWTLALFQFLNLYTVGRTPWTGDQPVAKPLLTHRTTQTQNKGTQTSMPRVGFEPTIPLLERAKTVHALDRAATVIGRNALSPPQITHHRVEEWLWKLRKEVFIGSSKTERCHEHISHNSRYQGWESRQRLSKQEVGKLPIQSRRSFGKDL
jgi:hypothetical protein